jgi:hypothetical protein
MSKRRPMTEEQWLHSASPHDMLGYLRQHCLISRQVGGRRKMRLFCCACCRQHWHLFTEELHRRAVDVSEQFADGLVPKTKLREAHQAVQAVWTEANAAMQRPFLEGRVPSADELRKMQITMPLTTSALYTADPSYASAALRIVHMGLSSAAAVTAAGVKQPEHGLAINDAFRRQAVLVRDIFGNPFRPFRLYAGDLGGKEGVVAKIARTIYDEHRFDEMPVLADALEEAGCADHEMVEHCRAPGEHARGCWVLDALLDKS